MIGKIEEFENFSFFLEVCFEDFDLLHCFWLVDGCLLAACMRLLEL